VLPMLLLTLAALEPASLKVFKGTEGQRVDVLAVKPVAEGRALIRVRASGSPFDGLVLEGKSKDGRVAVTYRGSEWTVLNTTDGRGRAFFPEVKEFTVKFDEEATGQVDPAALIADHAKQKASGELAMFAKKAYPHLTRKYEAKASAAFTCPGSTFRFDWASFTDDDMDNLDAYALCEPLAKAKCARLKASKVVCRMGPAFAVTRADDTLTFTTTAKGAADGASFLAGKL